jgi:DNA-binding XRE family transcriptional regulator
MDRPRRKGRAGAMPVLEVDGLPYIEADWLEWRIYRDWSRMQRWRQEAQRFARRTDPDGIAAHTAYLWQSLAMSYRVEKWRRCLAMTHAAIAQSQVGARATFGQLVQDRRIAAGMSGPELARRVGLDRKTVFNLEHARFLPSRPALQAILAVPELYLTWADVSPVLFQATPHKYPKNRRKRRE